MNRGKDGLPAMHHFLKSAVRLTVVSTAFTLLLGMGVSAAQTATVDASSLRLRSEANTSSSTLKYLSNGAKLDVLQTLDGWYKVSYNGTTGFVSADYVKVSGTVGTGKVTADVINLRSGAGTSYSVLCQLAKGKSVTVLDNMGGWYKVDCNGTTGYLSAEYVSLSAGSAEQSSSSVSGSSAVVTADVINLRSGAGTSYSIVRQLAKGTSVSILESAGGWYKVSAGSSTGYLSADYVKITQSGESAPQESTPAAPAVTPETQPVETPESSDAPANGEATSSEPAQDPTQTRRGIISGGVINVRTGPGTNYERVTKLSAGTSVTILEAVDGWYKISCSSASGYVSSDYVYETSTTASSVGAQVADLSKAYIGVRYSYGGSSPNGFDCSGFTQYLYKQFGHSLIHSASSQYKNNGVYVAREDLQPGDLVFFSSTPGGSITHVGIYIGNDEVIHARYSIGRVAINALSQNYYNKNYVGAKRIV